jgi:uncharacterized protein
MEMLPDRTVLTDIVSMTMPYGKYKGVIIKNIPVHYLEWMSSQGFPNGRLGMLLSTAFVIKTNGLEYLLNDISKLKG